MFLRTQVGFDATLDIFFCISLASHEHIVQYFDKSNFGIFGRTQPGF